MDGTDAADHGIEDAGANDDDEEEDEAEAEGDQKDAAALLLLALLLLLPVLPPPLAAAVCDRASGPSLSTSPAAAMTVAVLLASIPAACNCRMERWCEQQH